MIVRERERLLRNRQVRSLQKVLYIITWYLLVCKILQMLGRNILADYPVCSNVMPVKLYHTVAQF